MIPTYMFILIVLVIIMMAIYTYVTGKKCNYDHNNNLDKVLPSQAYAIREKGNNWYTFMLKIDFIEHEFLYNGWTGHITTIRVDKK